ncbi:MAG: DUF4062 domain-containing protein [Streptosporangiaceae bacterium]
MRESCLDDVGRCDLYVLILGHRYGFQPAEDNPEGRVLHRQVPAGNRPRLPAGQSRRTGPKADLGVVSIGRICNPGDFHALCDGFERAGCRRLDVSRVCLWPP